MEAAAAAVMVATYQWSWAREGWCVPVSGGFGECVVCVEEGGVVKVVFEEIPRQLKI